MEFEAARTVTGTLRDRGPLPDSCVSRGFISSVFPNQIRGKTALVLVPEFFIRLIADLIVGIFPETSLFTHYRYGPNL